MTTTQVRARVSPAGLMTGFHHLELWVGNARAFAHFLQAGFGFSCVGYGGPETGVSDRVCYLLAAGEISLLVTGALGPGPLAEHVARHGDGVRSVAIGLSNLSEGVAWAEEHGALVEPADGATPGRRVVPAYGETAIEFVAAELKPCELWPKLTTDGLPEVGTGHPTGLERIDHVVANVEQGRLDDWVGWHERVLGLRQMRHFDAEQISTQYSALRSTVLWNGGRVVLPINEPAPARRKSQIEEFLEAYCSPGIQHVALSTSDIVATVDELARRGVRFLVPPADYYLEAHRRSPSLPVRWEDLERLGILVDFDSGGHLLQVFTDPIGDRPTLFFEIIERRGAKGFGEGNFKALFEAIEREQARRGNL